MLINNMATCFALRFAVYEYMEIFEFPIGYNVDIKSLISVNEIKISKFHKKWGPPSGVCSKSLAA